MWSDEQIEAERRRTHELYHKPQAAKKKHPEKLIRDKIVKYLESIGALVINTPAGLVTVNQRTFRVGEEGRADLHCCYRGYWISIETKAPGKQPTAAQRHYRDRVVAAGGVWIKADSVDAVRVVIEAM